MPEADPWDPGTYHRFRDARSAPFWDLLELVRPQVGARIVDLGCGTGELTRELHRRVGAASTTGIDSSPAMLAEAAALAGDGLGFRLADIGELDGGGWDVVFSNAALQWVDDHPSLLRRLTGLLVPGGQLAVQVPANHHHASHTVAAEVAAEEPFRSELQGYVRRPSVLSPEAYATLLDRLGYTEQHVRLQVYGIRLEGPEQVVDWVRGTLLTDYERRMAPAAFQRFLARYRDEVGARLPAGRPYFYAFPRILFWGRRPGRPGAS